MLFFLSIILIDLTSNLYLIVFIRADHLGGLRLVGEQEGNEEEPARTERTHG